MTIDERAAGPLPSQGPADLGARARELIAEMMLEPSGQTSPSTYETARLVSLAPWLTGHPERVRHLLHTQRADGGWGPPEGYALVPTLSATEALLGVFRSQPPTGRAELAGAINRALQVLSGWLDGATEIPDTPAVDIIVPALIAGINEHLSRLPVSPLAEPELRSALRPLRLPPGMTGGRLAAVRDMLAAGAPVSDKLLHALEVVGDLARNAHGVTPLPSGTVGASPAATAAWLGVPDAVGSSAAPLAYLESTVARYGGLAPCATPITVFERAWVVSALARAGIRVTAPPGLIRSLTADLGARGTPAGPGLPADADTTSVTLYALGLLGAPVDPGCLWTYETPAGFCTWPGEDGFSVTTNAHVLDALGQHLAVRRRAAPSYRAAVQRLSVALREHQQPDGSWRDRWHASPYYATACCSLALSEFGHAPVAAEPLIRAVDWVLETQRPDGSWGRWAGTAEETAYAMQTLTAAGTRQRPDVAAAVARAHAYLVDAARQRQDPPLWHDKDLYRPTLIVRAAVLGAVHLAHRAGLGGGPNLLSTCA
ncbi:prenyltransferase/squalene oxidase repeat-containing protein [Micromonospora sp. NPDC050200]|uniref:prenyltransferase/squalene oxidase repeat-containing protein n=1 Tax=Micromonospora sp. NPDC050200 TaxID=3155664 RepID=UPI0033CB2543